MAYQSKPIAPPWLGVVDAVPAFVAKLNSFKTATGFMIDKQRIRTVPNRVQLAPWGATGPLIGQTSFVDVSGNIHTIFVTSTQAYYYVNGVYTPIGPTLTATLRPLEREVYQNKLIFTNGADQPQVIDGSAVPATVALPNGGVCFYLGKLAGRMLYLNLIDPGPGQPGTADNPRRLRWSMVNNFNNFSDPSSGSADVPEIEDEITGYATQGALGYIYRTFGITVMTPTGGISPSFLIENYTSGPIGVGNYYPYTLAQHGNLTAFAAEPDIYSFNPLLGPPQPIGGSSARSIYTDLNNATGFPTGAMVSTLGAERQGMQYWLAVPLAGNTSSVWMYQFDSQTWMKQTFPFSVTYIETVAVN